MVEIIFVFIFGLIIGSFLNCTIWRLYREEDFVSGKSYCPHCNHPLGFWDLFPLLSFLFLGGKCRYCKKKISWQYPLMELVTASIFVFIYSYFGPIYSLFSYQFFEVFFWLVIFSFILVIFVFDLKYYIIPDEVIYPAIVLAMSWVGYSYYLGVMDGAQVLSTIYCALGSAFFFFCLWFFSKGMAMGFGDVKLAILIGLLLGWPKTIVGLFLGFLFGAIIGLIMISLKRKNFKSEIPFGPFLMIGTFIALFWGNEIVNWYLSLSI